MIRPVPGAGERLDRLQREEDWWGLKRDRFLNCFVGALAVLVPTEEWHEAMRTAAQYMAQKQDGKR